MITHRFGTFFQLNDQLIFRGYGGLKSGVSNFQDAMKAGVTFFDGAYAYQDGAKLSEALAGRDIKQFVLSSKIPGFKLDLRDLRGSTEKCFQEIRERRSVRGIDILYLHGPDCIHKDVLDKLVEFKVAGKVQHIGLCNVDKRTVEALVNAGYPISVVQNEVNPFYWDADVLGYCHEKKIAVIGYRPFGDKQCAKLFENNCLKEVAHRVTGSVQDVIQQWMNQKGVTPIPHSNTFEHIRSNVAIPEWILTGEEVERIDSIKDGNASTCGWQKFLDKDLFAKSRQWIDTLAEVKKNRCLCS